MSITFIHEKATRARQILDAIHDWFTEGYGAVDLQEVRTLRVE
jgi:hypothetical protein